MSIERRGFLKSLAALLPMAAIGTVVTKQADAADKITPDVKRQNEKPATIRRPSTLKPDRHIQCSTSAFCDCPAERGMVVEFAKFMPNPLGSQYTVVRPGAHSGQPLGVILQDVVQNSTLTLSAMKDRVGVGSRVNIVQEGAVTVGPFNTKVDAGVQMYYDQAGRITSQSTGKPIGVTMSASDAEGFVEMQINLYVNETADITRPKR